MSWRPGKGDKGEVGGLVLWRLGMGSATGPLAPGRVEPPGPSDAQVGGGGGDWPFGVWERGAPALWRLGKGAQPYLQPFKFLKRKHMQPFKF